MHFVFLLAWFERDRLRQEIDVASAGADGITSAFGIINCIHFLGIQVFIFNQTGRRFMRDAVDQPSLIDGIQANICMMMIWMNS